MFLPFVMHSHIITLFKKLLKVYITAYCNSIKNLHIVTALTLPEFLYILVETF